MNNAQKEYKKLCEEIQYHNDLYYNQDAPEISDYEYDHMMLRLKKMEADHPEWVTADSPTQKVGGKRVLGIPVEHKVPMLSLEDVFSEKEVQEFVREIKKVDPNTIFSVEAKIDGLSLSLEYQDGELVRASTRGDGHEGEDVTTNARMIKNIPLKLTGGMIPSDMEGFFEIRGECYMDFADFASANEQQEAQGKKQFANARNCAAGTLRQADPNIVRDRGLSLLIFNVQQPNSALADLSHGGQLNLLEEWGFSCVPRKTCTTEEEVLKAIQNLGNNRSGLPFGIDGAVVKVNSIPLRRRLGERTKTPKWAIAFKYPPEEKETTLLNIRLQTGRTGRVTPVAEFESVLLAGSRVSNATLHNQKRIDELELCVGDKILVRKAGDIIPEVVRVTQHIGKTPFKMESCPICGAPLVQNNGEVDLYCSNIECPAILHRRLLFFGSKECMDIDGLGESTVSALIASGKVKSPADLYRLAYEQTEFPFGGDLGTILGSDKLANNLSDAIWDSRSRNAVNVLKALGWKNIGANVSSLLLKQYGSITTLFSTPREQLLSDVSKINGLGDVLISTIIEMVENPNMREEVDLLRKIGVNMTYHQEQASNTLAGMTFVITGTLPTLSRKEAQELIESNGGKVSGSVSKKTNYLVAGEAAGSKLKKAQELGIQIITEDQLKEMVK